MIQKLNVKAIAGASAVLWGIAYILCAIFVWIAPSASLGFFNLFFHGIDLAQIAGTSVTFVSSLIGLILTLVIAYAAGSLFAVLYNKLLKS